MCLLGTLLSASIAIKSGFAVDTGVPDDTNNRAKNLMRMNCGARVECVTRDGRPAFVPVGGEQKDASAAALIMDDDTLSFPLHDGKTSLIITLPRTFLIERFAFVNENAAACGDVKVEVSNYRLAANDRRWISAAANVSFTAKRFFQLRMAGVEAKYVKLSFHVEKQGRLAALALYGDQTLHAYAARQNHVTQAASTVADARPATAGRIEELLNFNFANSYAQAHVVYVSSGKLARAGRMIDDDALTAFGFAASDPHPTVILELPKMQRLHRVSVVYKMGLAHLEVYLLNEFPKNVGELGNLKSLASVFDRHGSGKAAVDFDPQNARYVALRWTSESSAAAEAFEVAEIAAFGQVPLSLLDLSELPDLFADNSVASHSPGEGGPDFSNSLGTLADPPANPPVIHEVSP